MRGLHQGQRRSGYGWGGSGYVPAYAVLPDADSDCACKKAQASENGLLAGLESCVRDNPILSLIGVFALGYVVSSKKRWF